jgi:hypothetical protein
MTGGGQKGKLCSGMYFKVTVPKKREKKEKLKRKRRQTMPQGEARE